MQPSLAAMLAVIEADVPERLISPHAFAALKSICSLLPISFSAGIGFESRLAEKAAEVDLILRVPVLGGLEILGGNNRSCRLPDLFFDDKCWERLRSLALDWTAKQKEPRGAVVDVWLEFDADRFASPVPTPGLLLLQIDSSDWSREYWNQVVLTSYAIVKNRSVHSELAGALDTCIERLPHHAFVLHAGMGISRPTDAVRLVLGGLSPSDMLSYLSSIGWPGNLGKLEALIFDLDRYTHQYVLHIDLLTAVCAKIGIECNLGQQGDSPVDARWTDFFDFIRRRGWCLPEKSEALLQWPGRNLFQESNESWPWVVDRFLNHVKINYDPASGVEAKAYFGLVWRRASKTDASTDES